MDSVFMKNEKISNLIDSDNVEGWEKSNTSTVGQPNQAWVSVGITTLRGAPLKD